MESMPSSSGNGMPVYATAEDVNALNGEGFTAIHELCKAGHLKMVQILFSCGADIEKGKRPCLYAACLNEHISIVKFLLESGADVKRYSIN